MGTDRSHRREDVLIAGGMLAIGLVLYAVGAFQLGFGPSSTPTGVRVALLVAIAATDTFRRIYPAAALTAGAVLTAVDLALGPTVPVWLVLSDLVYAAVLYGRPRVSRAVCYSTGAAVVVLTAAAYIGSKDVRTAAAAGILLALFFATPVWWALAIRRHQEVAAAERERAETMRALAEADRAAAVAHERNRMARDLHDVIASHLSAIAIQSEAALSRRTTPTDPALDNVLTAIRAGSVAALDEMRSMIDLLRAESDPDDRSAPPRLSDLDSLIAGARAAGSAVDASVTTNPDTLTSVVDHAAYRIVQESITNAVKHAPGQQISLTIQQDSDAVRLRVHNPVRHGPSNDPAPASGSQGLRNMTERAQLLGGRLHAGATRDGWIVDSVLPLEPRGTAE
ncbi:sensor histidine kinase [Prescottella agglutinans]|uniref:histidine kinase n=1 Tax=Prescottella agglutinans TaxID=1644129 RepID=A0ABT6M8I9_9NOCA|nr:histidine kinase [Prescottella agglutinans]MDH6280624.1 signal transduction histidine kinase [Prescottella agglutinans]